jgi:pimeloyl-ACP methyl ester carboxylesterase
LQYGVSVLRHDIDGPPGAPAVVLLHSSVADRRMWQPQWAPLLGAGFRVVRVDFQGYGQTPAPVETYDNAADVIEVLDHLGLHRVSVVGASFGGRVGQELAARWPDRVDRLVLLCAARAGHPSTKDIEAFAAREEELIEAGELDEAVALNVRTFVGPAASEEARALVTRMQRHSFEVQLAGPAVESSTVEYSIADIVAPTMVVSGAHDLDYFTGIADVLAASIPGATHTRLDWAGHLPSIEDPGRLNPLLLDFLAAGRPRPSRPPGPRGL